MANRKNIPEEPESLDLTIGEARAYMQLAQIYRKRYRFPYAEESWAIVRGLPQFARYEGLSPVGKPKTATHMSRRRVDRFVRHLFKRVHQAAECREVMTATTRELARMAQETIREILKPDGKFDDDTKLLNAKSKVALEMLKLGGLSQDTKGKTVVIETPLGGAIPEAEHDAVRTNRMAKYEETTGINPSALSFLESDN